MNKAIILLSGLAILCGCQNKSNSNLKTPEPFTTDSSVFSADGGHIQGLAVSEEAVYASQAPFLVKMDWTGKRVNSRKVLNHTGDLCWYDGELYAAVADMTYTGDNPEGEGLIQVYDKDLIPVRECRINRRTDGITILDGVLYIGMGSVTQPSKDPHRVNIIGRFDPKTLEEIAPRAEFDYGIETRYGFQNITNDGKYIYGSFYTANSGDPDVAVFDKDLNTVKTLHLNAYNGLDAMPASLSEGRLIFLKAKTITSSDPKSVSGQFDYWIPEE